MIEHPRSGKEKVIKDIRNLFRLKKEQIGTAIKDIKNRFRLKKWVKGIKHVALRNIKNLFAYEKENENYYKPVSVNKFWSNNYIKYKSNADKNRILSVEEYLYKIRPYLWDIINYLKQSDTRKIQLKITINFISSKDDNDEENAMHSKSDNMEIIISDEADGVIKKTFWFS